MKDKKVVLLAGEWDSTPIVYHYLQDFVTVPLVIIEDPVPRKKFLMNRVKKLGYVTVAGQVLFQLFVGKILRKRASTRIRQILTINGLKSKPIPEDLVHKVSSVNDAKTLAILQECSPDLVIVHGTRIISKKLLQQINCPFINIHAGITPRYRGSHGAYWALANNDKENCGVTVHLVDAGIDTGNILAQECIEITDKDNFSTYPYLQLAKGLELLKKVMGDLFAGKLTEKRNDLNSSLWYHPTIWYYLKKRISGKIR